MRAIRKVASLTTTTNLSRTIVSVFVFLTGSPAFAGGYLTAPFQGVVVTNYMINNGTSGGAGNGMTLWVSGISNPDSCGGVDKVHIKSDAPNFKEMVATVMSAMILGKKVGFWSPGCETIQFWGGTTTYPIAITLWTAD